MSDEFDAIDHAAVVVTAGGHDFTIRPITIDRLPSFARALRPIVPILQEMVSLTDESDPSFVADTLLSFVSENGELMAEALALAVASGMPDVAEQRKRIAGLHSADFVALAIPAVRVNADFFARQLLPLLLQVRQQAKAGAGPTPSST